MKIVIAGALTLAAVVLLHIPGLRKKKGVILALYAVGMILFFVIYNSRTLDRIIRFYHPINQTFYQTQLLGSKEYPDAFLEEYLKGKTVYTPDDAYDADENDPEKFDSYDNYWLYYFFHAKNMWNYLRLCGAEVVKDGSLNGVTVSDEQKAYYEDLGPANDLLRYTFPLNEYNGEWGNAFYFYWFYSSFIGDSRIYVCPQGLEDETELVLVWQDEGGNDAECYYIASKKYYDEVINPSHVDGQ